MQPLLFLFCITLVFASEQEPKVIIVGSGPAGIAAASKLLQNGITNLTILEAENRIGGRICSRKFEEYWIDLGAQWVNGEKNNVAYDLAKPLGLLSKSQGPGLPEEPPLINKFCGSSGTQLPIVDSTNFFIYAMEASQSGEIRDLKTGSMAEYMTRKLNEYYDKHSEISADLREPLTHAIHLAIMANEGAIDLDDVSANSSVQYKGDEGYHLNNWKERSYGTILDILMKKYPNPEEELPVVNKTLLNKKVTNIKYDEDGPVKVTTADGDEYTADHVISTPSLGVLKANHEKLFDPSLPEKNQNSIKHLGMGQNAKIFLYYEEPWWRGDNISLWTFFWTEADRREIENDPQRSWMLGLSYALLVEYKPNLFFLWMSGPYCEQMERIPDELFKNQTIGFVQRFFGNLYNVTQPKDIVRSSWNTNENFQGTYSYRSLASDAHIAEAADLGEPVLRNDKPVLQFAGEATDPMGYGNVHGAIASGWREADRLIDFYGKKK